MDLPPATTIEQRKKESNAEYLARTNRWYHWRSQEPLVDLWLVDDTEVAEYRKWAGTAAHHDRMVRDLMEVGECLRT